MDQQASGMDEDFLLLVRDKQRPQLLCESNVPMLSVAIPNGVCSPFRVPSVPFQVDSAGERRDVQHATGLRDDLGVICCELLPVKVGSGSVVAAQVEHLPAALHGLEIMSLYDEVASGGQDDLSAVLMANVPPQRLCDVERAATSGQIPIGIDNGPLVSHVPLDVDLLAHSSCARNARADFLYTSAAESQRARGFDLFIGVGCGTHLIA